MLVFVIIKLGCTSGKKIHCALLEITFHCFCIHCFCIILGLISADRSNKATLLLTITRSLFKSSAKNFALEKLDFGRFSA